MSDTTKHLLYGLLIILVAGLSFGLGRLSLLEAQKKPVTIGYFDKEGQAAAIALAPIPGVKTASPQADAATAATSVPETAAATAPPAKPSVRIVASKRGKKYYYETCSGAKSLSPANLVYYQTAAAAESAGLTIATNCSQP